jgi:hypothetical protein
VTAWPYPQVLMSDSFTGAPLQAAESGSRYSNGEVFLAS